ncbi:5'-deoxynucleotidase [Vibrio sp. D431a]|nr:5'-deoxynucleotidase [Vibrio sp. D431a]
MNKNDLRLFSKKKNKQSTFIAWFNRMGLIKRWSLMHTFQEENISEHSHQVAVISHLLTTIMNVRYGSNLCPDRAATLAIFHEVAETKTQDISTKIKYMSKEFSEAFKKIENAAEIECFNSLPDDLRKSYEGLIIQKEVDADYKKIVKAADVLSAYIKTLNELRFHNSEFTDVKINLEDILEQQTDVPAVQDFLNEFLENCTATLDKMCENY